MAGTLYLCATPIGNLEDITFRVLRTLKEVDLIAAEDTRHSIKLLNHFDIKTPMTSYHEYNKVDKARYLVGQLEEGVDIALITDAGTPGISDPGEELVRQCYEAGIQVTSLPGPAACITALTMSGLSTRRFCFEAFLPSEKGDKKERARILEEDTNLSELPAELYLFQGLPKSDKMELIIQKAVELGVHEVIPMATRRAVVKLDRKKEESKLKRWNTIAESAAKQSGRMMIPQVHSVLTMKEAFA